MSGSRPRRNGAAALKGSGNTVTSTVPVMSSSVRNAIRLPLLVAVSFSAATCPTSVTFAPWPFVARSAAVVTPSDSTRPAYCASGCPET